MAGPVRGLVHVSKRAGRKLQRVGIRLHLAEGCHRCRFLLGFQHQHETVGRGNVQCNAAASGMRLFCSHMVFARGWCWTTRQSAQLQGGIRAVQYHTSRGFGCLTIRSDYDVTPPKVKRGIPSCPCATLTSNGCSQMQRCSKTYCPPPPPPPPPPSCGTAPPWKCLFAPVCDPSDPDQSISFDATTGQIKSGSGLCADAVGCNQVPTLALAPCDKTAPTQQWTHSASTNQFSSIGCVGQCIDCFFGGTGNAGLYTCDGSSNQAWIPSGKTFSEDYAGKKCLSQAPSRK